MLPRAGSPVSAAELADKIVSREIVSREIVSRVNLEYVWRGGE